MTLPPKTYQFTILLFLSGFLFLSNKPADPPQPPIVTLSAGMYIPQDEASGIFSQVYFEADSLRLTTYQSCYAGNCEQATFQLEPGISSLTSNDSITGAFLELYLQQQDSHRMILFGRLSYPDCLPQTFVQHLIKE